MFFDSWVPDLATVSDLWEHIDVVYFYKELFASVFDIFPYLRGHGFYEVFDFLNLSVKDTFSVENDTQ